MAKLAKKSREERMNEIKRIEEYLQQYDTVVFIENSDIQNTCLQTLRSEIDGKIIIVKKAIFQRTYLNVSFEQNYFIVFTKQSELEKIKDLKYNAFLEAGDICPKSVVIKAGTLRNEKLVDHVRPIERKGANTILLEDFVVCGSGEAVQESQAKMLKIMGDRLGQHNFNILDVRNSKDLIKNK